MKQSQGAISDGNKEAIANTTVLTDKGEFYG
jgi:hypothetical protein